mgnify:FL=1
MLPTLILLVLLLGHSILAYGLYRQMLARKVTLHPILWLPILLMPYIGPLSVALVYWFMYSREDFQSIVVSQQEASAQDMDEQLSDEEDQAPISLQSSEDVRLWVPIEEALLLNDSAIKRELTMSMLKDQPSNVVALLQQARMNEDVEVVHYATVMLAELHKEYDLKIPELKRELLKQPDDIEILEQLCLALEDYLASGLVAGKFAESSRRQYIDLLRRKVAISHELKDYLRLGGQYLALGEGQRLRQILDYCQVQWPMEEAYRVFQFQALVAQGDRLGLQQFYQDIETRQVYLSRHNRQIIDAWRLQA